MNLVYQHYDGNYYNVEIVHSELVQILQSGQLYDRQKNHIKIQKNLYHKDNFGNLLHIYAYSQQKKKYYWLKVLSKIEDNNFSNLQVDFS